MSAEAAHVIECLGVLVYPANLGVNFYGRGKCAAHVAHE